MMTNAQVVAAKIKRVAQRISEGYEISEADGGIYLIWKNRDELLEVVGSRHGGPVALAIPADANPALQPADLAIKYDTVANRTYLY